MDRNEDKARRDLIASVEPMIHPANLDAFYRRVRELVSATRAGALSDAIALVKARGDVENHIVAPGLWFAAGWIRHHLLEPLVECATDSSQQASGDSRAQRDHPPLDRATLLHLRSISPKIFGGYQVDLAGLLGEDDVSS